MFVSEGSRPAYSSPTRGRPRAGGRGRGARRLVVSASALAALCMLSVGVLLYAVAGQGAQNVEAVQGPARVDRSPADPLARYRLLRSSGRPREHEHGSGGERGQDESCARTNRKGQLRELHLHQSRTPVAGASRPR